MKNKKVLVIGENCIDVFVYGYSKRKSPEGEGMVFLPHREVYADGMAYNTSNNLTSMGVDVDMITNVEEITKRRYIDDETNHLFLRVDENDDVRRYDVSKLPELDEYDAVLISDYDKGFLTENDIAYIAKLHPLVIVDTKKILGEWCRDIRFIKINRIEFLNNADAIIDNSWLDEKLLVTLDEDGTIHRGVRYPAEEVEVVDICGAGDTFIAGFTKEYISTNDVSHSIVYANKVASVVIQKKGIGIYTE
jgi:D-beta-D-heptose 7-phosphate kinase/D-beta-D-heptose 1-phosphate adenosyltransferase